MSFPDNSCNLLCFKFWCGSSLWCLDSCITSIDDQVDTAIELCKANSPLSPFDTPICKQHRQTCVDLLDKALAKATPEQAFQLIMKFTRRASSNLGYGQESRFLDSGNCEFYRGKDPNSTITDIKYKLLNELKRLGEAGHKEASDEYEKRNRELNGTAADARSIQREREWKKGKDREARIQQILDTRLDIAGMKKAYEAALEAQKAADAKAGEADNKAYQAEGLSNGIRMQKGDDHNDSRHYYNLAHRDRSDAATVQRAAKEAAAEAERLKNIFHDALRKALGE